MKNQIKISVPKPCHENWANMTPDERGRFCASCQKTVIDFSRSSDRQIIETLKNGKNICGRFTPSQLGRKLVASQGKSKFWSMAGATALTLLAAGITEANGQTPTNMEQHENKAVDEDKKVSQEEPKITGTVVDSQGMPIPGAIVKVKGTDISVQTDLDGVYSIEAREGDILEFTYVGMDVKTVSVSEQTEYGLEVVMLMEDITGMILVDYEKLRISVASQYMFNY